MTARHFFASVALVLALSGLAQAQTPSAPATGGGSSGALALTSGHIFVGSASNVATDVAASGDLTLTNTGAFTVAKIQGTAVSGTTGTGNVMFSASPTSTGTLAAAAVAIGGATIGANALAVTGTANISGIISGVADSNLFGSSANLFSNIDVSALAGFGSTYLLNSASTSKGLVIAAGFPISWNSAGSNTNYSTLQSTTDLYVGRAGPATFLWGLPDAAAPVAQTQRVQSVVAGTAAANGANWTFIGSLPTGTGTSGNIIFQTGVKTGSGTTQGTPTTALTLFGETQNAVFAASLKASSHILATSASPTISACGTGSPTASGSDSFGSAIAGTVATSCVINFGTTWGAAPSCSVSSNTAISSLTVATSTTQLTITGTALNGDALTWVCGSTAGLFSVEMLSQFAANDDIRSLAV